MSNLAIHGGRPTVAKQHVPWPPVTAADRAAVKEVLDAGIFWGPFSAQVKGLQEEWAKYIGTKHCIATNSGTAALHVAVAAAGIGPGDEVITTALTFVASALAVLQQNAIPVFVDIDPDTFCLDPAKIESRITERTKAIIPVHLHGQPADMDEINAIARKHKLTVIEDACQAHGAFYKGRKVGTLGQMAAFSLNGSKNLPGGEGGLFNTDSDTLKIAADKVKSLGEFIEEGVERDYNAFEVGWMYRYSELNAAFARSKLKSLDAENEVRRKNAEFLTRELGNFKGIIPPVVKPDRTSVYHLYRIQFDPQALGLDVSANEFRGKVQKALRAEGVQANRWGNRPVPMQKLFQQRKGYGKGYPWAFGDPAHAVQYKMEDYPVTKKIVENSIVIHDAIYPPNDTTFLRRYIEAFQKLWDNLAEVLEVQIGPEEIYLRE